MNERMKEGRKNERLHECSYLGMDGASSGDNAGDPLSCQWDVAQQHTSMDGEVVHTLQHSALSAGQNTTTMEPQMPGYSD